MREIQKRVFKLISFPNISAKQFYKMERTLQNLTRRRVFRARHSVSDYRLAAPGRSILLRAFSPKETGQFPIILFFHGGGWATGSVDSYDKVCRDMADQTQHIVFSVDYRLAPEHTFPAAPEDCYFVTQFFLKHAVENGVDPKTIVLAGDSAGGNLAAVVSLMSRDRSKPIPCKQILIYPATDNKHGNDSPYASVYENGENYILTSKRVSEYLELYQSSNEDTLNPYFSPMNMAGLSNQPDTLIITAEFDPLRDEGEAYGKRLAKAGAYVETFRIQDALHGFMSNAIFARQIRQSYTYINAFLLRKTDRCCALKQKLQEGE